MKGLLHRFICIWGNAIIVTAILIFSFFPCWVRAWFKVCNLMDIRLICCKLFGIFLLLSFGLCWLTQTTTTIPAIISTLANFLRHWSLQWYVKTHDAVFFISVPILTCNFNVIAACKAMMLAVKEIRTSHNGVSLVEISKF